MTTAQAITNGFISTHLCVLYNKKQSIFNGGALAAPKSPVHIQMVSDALNWGYTGGAQTDADIDTVKNYLIWLTGIFGLEASESTGSGGSVIPINPSLTPSRIDFIVDGSSFIPNGGTSKVISQMIGYEISFVRGGLVQSTISTEPTYISWNKVTGLLTITPALVTGELISIIP